MLSDAVTPSATKPWPAIYLSHGSPMIALEPGRAGAFFGELGRTFDRERGRPRAIVAISAHTALPPAARRQGVDMALLAAPQHEAIYDFGGFDPRLSTLRYDAPGAPELATQVVDRVSARGIRARALPQGGLDHGIWTALRYLYPDADVPVLPLAWPIDARPSELMAIGEALAPLRHDGVLVLGTGSITHNLRLLFGKRSDAHGSAPEDEPEIPESQAFRQWWADRSAAHDWAALLDWQRQAPHAQYMHPTDEHLLPWFVAAGAGGRDGLITRVHQGVTFGCLGMDAYGFGDHLADTIG